YSFFNASTISKMQLMIWNSFDLSDNELSSKTILNPYRLNQYEPCKERVFTFRYKRHIFLNGTEKWDMNYRSELGIGSNAFGTNKSATGVIHFKPESFQVQTTREHQLFPLMSVITMFIILLAVLYTTYYSWLGGPSRYRITGLAHMITRYYPQQHIKLPSYNSYNSRALKPSAEDILKAYLVDVDKSKFENK
ncbi:22003_t:CDS:2, partial [Dentiscutata erythropus]